MTKERRQHPRAESDWIARIQRELHSLDGVIRNVSRTGVFVCCDHRLLPGERVRIAIEFTDRLPLVIDAEVVWSRILSQEESGGLYGIGLRYVDVSDEDRRLIDLAVSEYLKTESSKLKNEKTNE